MVKVCCCAHAIKSDDVDHKKRLNLGMFLKCVIVCKWQRAPSAPRAFYAPMR